MLSALWRKVEIENQVVEVRLDLERKMRIAGLEIFMYGNRKVQRDCCTVPGEEAARGKTCEGCIIRSSSQGFRHEGSISEISRCQRCDSRHVEETRRREITGDMHVRGGGAREDEAVRDWGISFWGEREDAGR